MNVSRDPRLVELGEFLRSRRGAIQPDAVGLAPSPPRRQVAGLRREEVADLAFISREYYVRIEQGKVPPSKEVLDRLTLVLRLNEDQRRYARELLAGVGFRLSPEPAAPVASGPMLRLINQLTDIPAILVGPQTAILAWNDAAARLFIDFSDVPQHHRTFVRLLFAHKIFQSRFPELVAMQKVVVGILRSTSADSLSHRVYSDKLQELSAISPAFHEMWHQVDVAQPRGLPGLPLRHPDAGDIVVDQISLLLDDPSQRLLLFVLSGT